MTLWAMFGQLLITWFLLDEVTPPLSSFVDVVFEIAILSSAFFSVVYGVASVPWTLNNLYDRKGRARHWIKM
jgi:hypothetical protein